MHDPAVKLSEYYYGTCGVKYELRGTEVRKKGALGR